jgi:hypothetical protein
MLDLHVVPCQTEYDDFGCPREVEQSTGLTPGQLIGQLRATEPIVGAIQPEPEALTGIKPATRQDLDDVDCA